MGFQRFINLSARRVRVCRAVYFPGINANYNFSAHTVRASERVHTQVRYSLMNKSIEQRPRSLSLSLSRLSE